MKRSLVLPSVVSVASLVAASSLGGCDLTQELQGVGTDGGGAAGPMAPNDGAASVPVAPGDAATPPMVPAPDGGAADGSAKRPISICLPNANVGSAKILVDGSENPYMRDVNDIAFTSSRVFVLSSPFSFIGAPYGGGNVDSYSMTATLPSFMGLAIGAAKASAGGSRTNQNLDGAELPSSGGRVFGLRGSSAGSASDRLGELVIDGSDLVFWTRSPSQLVQASLTGAAERVLADYPDATKRTVTAMGLDSTDIWFASAITNGAAFMGGTLHRAPRAGGAVVDVANLPNAVVDILFDGNTIHMATANPPFGSGELMLDYSLTAGTVTYRSLMQKSLGSSPVAFDGTFFYWAESNGADTCNGTFKRRNKNGAPEETLLSNLDRVVRLRARSGAFYLGSSAYPFRKPATPGQLIEWKP